MTVTIKYPRFRREEKLSAKLSAEDIKDLKSLSGAGLFSQAELGEMFGVAQNTVSRVIMSDEDIKRLHIRNYSQQQKCRYQKEKKRASEKRTRERKKLLCFKEYQEYYLAKDKKYKKRVA